MTVAAAPKHKCSNCGNEFESTNLTAKQVRFTTLGRQFRVLRSRTVGHLCDDCRADDPAWTQEKYRQQREGT